MYALTTITPPASEPVSLDEARKHLRVDHHDEDGLIQLWVAAARGLTEEYTGRRWIEQELLLTLSDFDCGGYGGIRLPVEPVVSVDGVSYYADDGTLTVLDAADYQTLLGHRPPIVAPGVSLGSWPAVEAGRLGAVLVEFTAGYANAAAVPAGAKAAMLLCLAHWYEHRGDSDDPADMPGSVGMPAAARRMLYSLASGAYL